MAGSSSGDAALAGLAAEADRERSESNAVAELRSQRISDQLSYSKKKTLLDTTYPKYRNTISLMRQGLSGLSLLDD
jgi:hypothetical protein